MNFFFLKSWYNLVSVIFVCWAGWGGVKLVMDKVSQPETVDITGI